jgi:hypothetical protein
MATITMMAMRPSRLMLMVRFISVSPREELCLKRRLGAIEA